MKLIAESGSTKTDWRLINHKNEISDFQTIGLNPYFVSSEDIKEELDKNLLPYLNPTSIEKVYFYGSGCGNLQKKDIVREPLEQFFRLAKVEVEHDLLGAARALCGHEKGIACILGTGSNSCLYDGRDIIENVPSVGYFFGDEGGGAYLGKKFIGAYLKNELPDDIKNSFESQFSFRFDYILDTVYKKPFPNRFLASFSPFFLSNIHNNYIREMIFDAFDMFFHYQVSKYTDYKKEKIGFTGSIAYHFRELLLEVAKKWEVNVFKIDKKPMEGLTEFHKSEI